MCWMAAAAIASVVASAVSAAGAIQQGNAAHKQGEAQAAAAEYNRQVSEINARQARLAAGVEEDRQREQNARVLSGMRAAAAAGGSTLEGSTLSLVGDAATQLEYDAILKRYQGEVRAAGYGNQANLDSYEGQIARASGRAAQVAGYLGAGGNLLRGAGNLALAIDAGAFDSNDGQPGAAGGANNNILNGQTLFSSLYGRGTGSGLSLAPRR